MITLLSTHGHPTLHPWSPFSALMVFCSHDHPSSLWSPISPLMVTLLCTHGHPSLHSWSPFITLVTLLSTHGHLYIHGIPSLHSWSPFSDSWSPFSVLMLILLCTIDQPSLHSRSLTVCMATHLYVNDSEYWNVIANKLQTHTVMHILINVIVSTLTGVVLF